MPDFKIVSNGYRQYLGTHLILRNYVIYLSILLAGLAGFCFTDVFVRDLPHVVYTRISTLFFGVFLLIICFSKLRENPRIVIVFNNLFSFSLMSMGFSFVIITHDTVHFKSYMSALIVAIMLVSFFVKGKTDILVIYLVPFSIFILFLVFYMKPTGNDWLEYANPLAMFLGSFIVTLMNEKSRFNEYYYKTFLEVEKMKTEMLYKETNMKNAELQQQKEEILTINEQLEDQKNELENSITIISDLNSKLESKNNAITESINYARRIQDAILPTHEDMLRTVKDYFILYKPCNIVSGDFYWQFSNHRYSIVAVVDCTGHGIPGGFMSMLGYSLLNETVQNMRLETACGILNSLKEKVRDSLHARDKLHKNADGLDVSLCMLDKHEQKIHFAGAYMPIVIVRNNAIIEIKGDRMPIGYFVKDLPSFSNHEFLLEENDRFYIFSDGFKDQVGGPNSKRFLSSNLKNLIVMVHNLPFDEQKAIFDNAFEQWKGDRYQIDDVLVVGFEF